MALLLQLSNQHCYILVKKSPDFTVGFTFYVVYFLNFFKCRMTCIHHYNVTELVSSLQKSRCSTYSSLSLLPPLATIGLFTVSVFSGSQYCIIYIFLMTYDIEYLFICLLIICMSSLVRCLFRYFFPLYNGFVLLLNFTSALSMYLKSHHHIQVHIGYFLSSRNFMVCAL